MSSDLIVVPVSLLARVSPSQKAAESLIELDKLVAKAENLSDLEALEQSIRKIFADYKSYLKSDTGTVLRPARKLLSSLNIITSKYDIRKLFDQAMSDVQKQKTIAQEKAGKEAEAQLILIESGIRDLKLLDNEQDLNAELERLTDLAKKVEETTQVRITQKIKESYTEQLKTLNKLRNFENIARRLHTKMITLFPENWAEIDDIYVKTKEKMQAKGAKEANIINNLEALALTLTNTAGPLFHNPKIMAALVKTHSASPDTLRQFDDPVQARMPIMKALERIISDPKFADKTPEEIRSNLACFTIEEKLKTIGMRKPEHIPILAQIIAAVQGWQQQVLNEVDQLDEVCNPTHPVLIGALEGELKAHVREGFQKAAEQVDFERIFKNPKELESMKPLFMGVKNSLKKEAVLLREKQEQRAASDFAFVKKWGHLMTVKASQGSRDKHEDLGSGVCLGISLRVLHNIQENPTAKDEELQADVIKPDDRYFEAAHMVAHGGIPATYCQKVKQEPFMLFAAAGNAIDFEAVKKIWHKEKALLVIIKNHALCQQFDPKNKIFRIQDPNFGIIRAPDEKVFAEFFQDLLKLYDSEDTLGLVQMLPANP